MKRIPSVKEIANKIHSAVLQEEVIASDADEGPDPDLIEIRPEKIIDKKYQISSFGKEGLSGSLKICFFSDVHGCVDRGEPEQYARILEDEEPDLVLCSGDMITANRSCDAAGVAAMLNGIGARYPLYLSLGNHESRAMASYQDVWQDFYESLNPSDVRILDNERELLDIRGIPVRVCGLTIRNMYYRRIGSPEIPPVEVREALGIPDPSEYTILLAHNPSGRNTYLKWGADLTLCGHYHGGIMRFGSHRGIVTPDMRLFSDDSYGLYEKAGKHVIITSGAGEHAIPVRINNPREIVSITVNVNP
ncbi:MAG: metallophosphoesterase [Eubacteriales bacterium]|jgi:predicted MPP superfamily phosphohydrolase